MLQKEGNDEVKNGKEQNEEKKKKHKKIISDNDEGEGEIGKEDGKVIGNIMKKSEKKSKTSKMNETNDTGKEKVGEKEDVNEVKIGGEGDKQMRKKNRKEQKGFSGNENGVESKKVSEERTMLEAHSEDYVAAASEKVGKKRKRENSKSKINLDNATNVDVTDCRQVSKLNTKEELHGNQEKGKELAKCIELCDGNDRETVKKKKKKDSIKNKNCVGDPAHSVTKDFVQADTSTHSNITKKANIKRMHGKTKKKTKGKEVAADSAEPKTAKSNKKVRFNAEIEIFTTPDDPSPINGNSLEEKLIRGKRFSREEDQIVKDAVYKYIEAYKLGEEGLNMVLNCSSYPKVKNCWKEIGAAIPYRPYTAIYYRAQVLFRRSEKRKWTEEEYEIIRKHHEEHGNKWKDLADGLGKHRFHVKDTWRRIKMQNLKKGHWSQEEYQNLFDLVNTDLQMKYSEEKKSKHGMLRDNIPWVAISDKLATRTDATCCLKWYNQLTSPMVAEGLWADADDYRLINALFCLDASCPEDVDWDNIVEHRSGNICRKRWNQMVLHIGHHGSKSFAEQVEVLAKRYCPDLLEAREAWDSKPIGA